MAKKEIKIYEPAMCCSSGMCGPAPDKEIVDFNGLIKQIEGEGYSVRRFMLGRDVDDFAKEEQVMELLRSGKMDVLPITVIAGKIIKKGDYPSHSEITGAS